MVIISGLTCVYYNVIVAWTLYYLFKSFAAHVPWATCDNWWNTDACAFHHDNPTLNATLQNVSSLLNTSLLAAANSTGTGSGVEDTSSGYHIDETDLASIFNRTLKKRTASEEYWQ